MSSKEKKEPKGYKAGTTIEFGGVDVQPKTENSAEAEQLNAELNEDILNAKKTGDDTNVIKTEQEIDKKIVNKGKSKDKANIKKAEEKIGKIKKDSVFIKAKTVELFEQGYSAVSASEIAEIEAMIKNDEERVAILRENTGIKDGEKRLKKAEENIKENVEKIKELKAKETTTTKPVAPTENPEEKAKKQIIADAINELNSIERNEQEITYFKNRLVEQGYPENIANQIAELADEINNDDKREKILKNHGKDIPNGENMLLDIQKRLTENMVKQGSLYDEYEEYETPDNMPIDPDSQNNGKPKNWGSRFGRRLKRVFSEITDIRLWGKKNKTSPAENLNTGDATPENKISNAELKKLLETDPEKAKEMLAQEYLNSPEGKLATGGTKSPLAPEIMVSFETARENYFTIKNNPIKKDGLGKKLINAFASTNRFDVRDYEIYLKEKEDIYQKTKIELVQKLLSEGREQEAKEFVTLESEKKLKNDIENGPLSPRIKAGISKGLNKWEKWGEKETEHSWKTKEGWKGLGRRLTKMTANIAMIGLLSCGSVEGLAKMGIGTASALSGGAISVLTKRLLVGTAIGSVIEATPEKYKKAISLIITIGLVGTMAGISIGSGAWVAGAAIAGSSALGYVAPRIFQKSLAKKETAISEKVKAIKNESLLDINNLENSIKNLENRHQQVLKQIENKKVLGAIGKTLLSVAVSTASMETMGAVKDHHTTHIKTDHAIEHAKQDHLNTLAKTQHIKDLDAKIVADMEKTHADNVHAQQEALKAEETARIEAEHAKVEAEHLKAEAEAKATAEHTKAEVEAKTHTEEQIKTNTEHHPTSAEIKNSINEQTTKINNEYEHALKAQLDQKIEHDNELNAKYEQDVAKEVTSGHDIHTQAQNLAALKANLDSELEYSKEQLTEHQVSIQVDHENDLRNLDVQEIKQILEIQPPSADLAQAVGYHGDLHDIKAWNDFVEHEAPKMELTQDNQLILAHNDKFDLNNLIAKPEAQNMEPLKISDENSTPLAHPTEQNDINDSQNQAFQANRVALDSFIKGQTIPAGLASNHSDLPLNTNEEGATPLAHTSDTHDLNTDQQHQTFETKEDLDSFMKSQTTPTSQTEVPHGNINPVNTETHSGEPLKTFEDGASPISHAVIAENAHQDYVHHLDTKSSELWNEWKNSTDKNWANSLITKETDPNNELHSIISHFNKLHDVTGLSPREANLLNPVPETPEEFDLRCYEKAAEMGPDVLKELNVE